MSNRLVNPNPQFFDNSGQPLNGGILRTYVTSSSTPAPTYSDPSLSISNGTYIILDSSGRSPVSIFLDPAVTLKVTLETSAGVVLWTRDPVVDLAANINASVQVYAGNPNTHVAGNAGTPGSTGASLLYDITNSVLYICTTTGTATTAVWTAVSNSFTAGEDIYTSNQTITVANKGRIATANSVGAITFALTAAATVGVGFFDFKNINTGALTIDPAGAELIEGIASIILLQGQGAVAYSTGSVWRVLAFYDGLLDVVGRRSFPTEVTVASAATCNILGAASEAVAISGVVTITSFGTGPNRHRYVRATGAFLLTHSTALICPGAQNITTASGDTFEVVSDISNNARIINYQRAASPPPSIATPGLSTGFLFGLTLQNDAAGTLAVTAGAARDSTDVDTMVLAAAIGLKDLGVAWSVGASGGLLDTGAVANAWYYVFLIKRTDTGVVDVLASLSATAPTMPANYTEKRRIGAIFRTGGAIKFFNQVNDHFVWLVPANDYGTSNPGTAAVSVTLTIPVAVAIETDISFTVDDITPAVGGIILVTSPSQTNSVPGFPPHTLVWPSAGAGVPVDNTVTLRIPTDTGAIRFRSSVSNADVTMLINTNGWYDARGRLS